MVRTGPTDDHQKVLIEKRQQAEEAQREAYKKAKSEYKEAMKNAKDKDTKNQLKKAYEQAMEKANQDYITTYKRIMKEYEEAKGISKKA